MIEFFIIIIRKFIIYRENITGRIKLFRRGKKNLSRFENCTIWSFRFLIRKLIIYRENITGRIKLFRRGSKIFTSILFESCTIWSFRFLIFPFNRLTTEFSLRVHDRIFHNNHSKIHYLSRKYYYIKLFRGGSEIFIRYYSKVVLFYIEVFDF